MSCTNATCLTSTTGVASQVFTSALQFFAASQCLLDDKTLLEYTFAGESLNYESFDFIIVGSASSGCVLANRLSEQEDWNILLIEAGGDPPIESTIPRLSTSILYTEYEWGFESINNGKTNQAVKNGTVHCRRGKMLGGTSNANEMMYFKGTPSDYTKWQGEGNEDWSPELVDRYFKKAESLQDQSMLQDPSISKSYGHNGPLVINRFNSTYRELTEKILVSFGEIGSPWVSDLNTAHLLGSGIFTATAANGIRQSASRDYLDPILAERKNLKILKNTLVTKVLIDDLYSAYGVEAEHDGKIMQIYAKREVILSAGAVNSPHLLMLSGVGPCEVLRKHDIPCRVESPFVGKNLQSHNFVPIIVYGDGSSIMTDADIQYDAIEYLFDRKGHLAQSYVADIVAFRSINPNSSSPEFMAFPEIIGSNSESVGPLISALNESVVESVKRELKDHTLFAFYCSLQHPLSRGSITLRSKDPKENPLINLNVFDDPRDLTLAAKGHKLLSEIVNTDYFKSINAYLGRLKWEPCDSFEVGTEDYSRCICENMAVAAYHLSGTCKMGPDSRTSVVDSRLRVHGVNNLRVVDESITPTITTGGSDGPVVMIGERAADLIKEDNKRPMRPKAIISIIEIYGQLFPQDKNDIVPNAGWFS